MEIPVCPRCEQPMTQWNTNTESQKAFVCFCQNPPYWKNIYVIKEKNDEV